MNKNIFIAFAVGLCFIAAFAAIKLLGPGNPIEVADEIICFGAAVNVLKLDANSGVDPSPN